MVYRMRAKSATCGLRIDNYLTFGIDLPKWMLVSK